MMLISTTIPFSGFAQIFNAPSNLYLFYVGPSVLGRAAYALALAVLLCNKVWILNFLTIVLYIPGVVLKFWGRQLLREAGAASVLCRRQQQLQRSYSSMLVFTRVCWPAICPRILPLFLANCSVLCIVGCSMLILFHRQLQVMMTLIIVDIIFFILFGSVYGLNLMVDILHDTQEFLHQIKCRGKDECVGRVLRSHWAVSCEVGIFSKTARSIVLQVFGFMAENIANLVIGFREF